MQLTHVGLQKVSDFLLVFGEFTPRIAYFRQVQHLPLSWLHIRCPTPRFRLQGINDSFKSVNLHIIHTFLQLFDRSKVTTDATRKDDYEKARTPPRLKFDRVSTLEMCRIINDEDKTVPLAVECVLPDIAAAIDVIHAQVSGGGRLIYLGAGRSRVVWVFWMPANVRPPTA
ncbi:hypothetical protein ACLB1S_22015 [Escherichia coli]